VSWKSSDTKIVKITGSSDSAKKKGAVIKGLKRGTATVTAVYGTKTKIYTVTVSHAATNGSLADPTALGIRSMAYLYNTYFAYKPNTASATSTLKDVLRILSTGRQEGFSARVDAKAFENSVWGAKTAENWYTYINWAQDPMNPKLVSYWESKGLKKEAYYDKEGDNDGITGDYYVYSPIPKNTDTSKYPLILLFHGGGEPAFQTETFGFCDIAAREGIILCSMEQFTGQGTTNQEKYANLEAILHAVEEKYPVDKTRVYIVGSSMGGANAMGCSLTEIKEIAACGVMDQPVSFSTRMFSATDSDVANVKTYGLPMVYVGGLADMYGLYNMHDKAFFSTAEGSEERFITGWNQVMDAFGITGKTLTAASRQAYADNPANKAEYWQGYPFDNVQTINLANTNTLYKCTMNANKDLCLYMVENRPHMPSGYDAENIWNFISHYSRDLSTGKSVYNK